MNVFTRHLGVAALTAGLALTGVFGVPASASAAEATPAIVESAKAPATAQSQGWLHVDRWTAVFSEYGGPTTIGSTADELIYAYCQHDGSWGWQTYAWVPSLQVAGWLRNGDITGYTNPIPGLDYC
jgi:hypothetical protein